MTASGDPVPGSATTLVYPTAASSRGMKWNGRWLARRVGKRCTARFGVSWSRRGGVEGECVVKTSTR